MHRAGQAGVIVEPSGDDRDADGRSLEARHHVLVAPEHVDVAPIADVPAGSFTAVADSLGSLVDQSIAHGTRRAPPVPGLVGGPWLLQPGTHRLEHPFEAVRQPVQGLAGIDQPRRRQHERDRDADRRAEERVQGPPPGLAPLVRRHGREHDQQADGHLPRRGTRQPQHQLGDAERHGDDHGDGDAVELQEVADGHREEHAEHHRGAALERREDRCAHRDLDDDEGGQRREDRVRRARDRLRDRPSQSGRQSRLGHGGDLGRRRTRPRDGVDQAPPQSPDTIAEATGRLCRHDRRYRRSPHTAPLLTSPR